MRSWIVYAAAAWSVAWLCVQPSAALGAPRVTPQAQYRAASAQYSSGNYDQALALLDKGLAVAPKDVKLLRLRATLLLELRNYSEALIAFDALLAAGVRGADRLRSEEIVKKLRAVQTTSLDITFTNGPATAYLDSKSLGALCPAGPSCKLAVLPDEYTVIVERDGFVRWSNRVTVASGQTTQLSVTLLEKPSPLAVQVAPAGAEITVDGAPFDAAKPLPAGRHVVAAALDRHQPERREVVAREGKPIELALTLVPLVPVRIEPAGAALQLDGRPAAASGGTLALPAGAHSLIARARGFQDRKIEIPAERPDDYAIEAKLDAVVVPPPPPAPPPGPGIFSGRRKLALAAGGVGLAALGAGVYLGLSARGLDSDAYALCASPSEPCEGAAEANDLNERARARARTANIAYGIAGGAAVTAAILWLTGSSERRPASPGPRVSVTPRLGSVAGLDLAVRF